MKLTWRHSGQTRWWGAGGCAVRFAHCWRNSAASPANGSPSPSLLPLLALPKAERSRRAFIRRSAGVVSRCPPPPSSRRGERDELEASTRRRARRRNGFWKNATRFAERKILQTSPLAGDAQNPGALTLKRSERWFGGGALEVSRSRLLFNILYRTV